MDDSDTSAEPPEPAPHARPAAPVRGPVAIDVVGSAGPLGNGVPAWLAAKATEAVETLGAGGEVRVRLVDDQAMSAAHARYSGIPGTTDVLTFDLAGDGRTLDVDLLVCVDEARRQAELFGHAPERELLLYIIHGVLHCLGHDDADDAGAGAMHRLEDEILDRIGVGATFAPSRRASAGEGPA